MKIVKKITLLPLIPVLLFLSSCFPADPETNGQPPVPKEITAVQTAGPENGGTQTEGTADGEADLELEPLVDLDPDFIPVRFINTNLDLDQNDEQIIFGKSKDDPDSAIELKLIDFDTVSEEYFLAWEGTTQATNIRTFIISFIDIIGDHKQEIICSGIDKDGLRSLDVFRQTFSPEGIGLYYMSICAITADGSIDIHEYERSQAYKQGQRNGRSFPIITFSQNKDTENIMDLIREEYYWKYQENRYVKGKVEYIPGRKIEATQLRELFTADTKAFEDFLSGPWFSGDLEVREQASTIFFDPAGGQIVFYSDDIQEMYEWESSHRTRIPNSIYIAVTNQMVPFIKKYISIYVESLDSIKVEINDRDFTKSNYMWDGSFTRLHEAAEKSLIPARTDVNQKDSLTAPLLNGEYRKSGGDTLTFNHPYVEMDIGGVMHRGKYSLYQTEDGTILDIKVLSESNTVRESRKYLFEQEIDETERVRIYRMALIPGEFSVTGFSSFDDTSDLYIRYETLESENSGEE